MAGEQLAEEALALATEKARVAQQGEIRREMGKYSAAAADRLSTAFIASGLITPAIAMYFRLQPMTAKDWIDLGITFAICLVTSIVLHLYGKETLEDALK